MTLFPEIGARTIAAGATFLFFLAAPSSADVFRVTTTSDTPDANPGDGICADANGDCSLRAAIQESNALGGWHTIILRAGNTDAPSISGSGEDAAATGDLDVTSDIALRGIVTYDARGLDRMFDVHAGGRLVVNDATITGGAVMAESGGGARNAGTLIINRTTIDDCTATGMGASGGALFNDGGDLAVFRSTLSGGMAERAGGAIEANGGTTRVFSSEITGNTCGPNPGNGGGFHLTGAGDVTMVDSTFADNVADSEGGGVWNSGSGTMYLDGCNLENNAANGTGADNGGGGLFNDGGFMFVSFCDLTNNTADQGSGSGGGLLNDGGVAYVEFCEIDGNRSSRAGGGVEAAGGVTEISLSWLRNNDAGASPGNGGGLHISGDGIVIGTRINVANNTAVEGGGLWNSGAGELELRRSIVNSNTATGDAADQGGGGLYNDGGIMRILRSTVSSNTASGASGSGGGALNNGGDLAITATRMEDNVSSRAGGAIEANVGTTRLLAVQMIDNSTGASPGNGGGLHLTGAGDVEIEFGVITNNAAAAEGGGLWNSATGTMTVTNSQIAMNSAPIGPNNFNDGGTFTVNGVPVP